MIGHYVNEMNYVTDLRDKLLLQSREFHSSAYLFYAIVASVVSELH